MDPQSWSRSLSGSSEEQTFEWDLEDCQDDCHHLLQLNLRAMPQELTWSPARELEYQKTELRYHSTFYKEQLEHIERKNAEMYKLSSQQFHEAASKMEGTIKPHRLQPVCSGLQAQILRCYNDHLHEVLLCSDLVKAYQHCVTTAHKG